MKFLFRALLISLSLLLAAGHSLALPTPCGTTGLLTQPTAQTLNSGNICIGLWGDHSEWAPTASPEYNATVMPFSLTLGIGSFVEVYGSYPNLLFNDEETASGRGAAIIGTKMRLLGKRSSPFKFAVEGQFKRTISLDSDVDGLTDFLGRGVISVQTRKFGLHGWGGILDREENLSAPIPIGPFDDVIGYGGGIEFLPMDRLRIIAEAEIYEEEDPGTLEMGEWMAGFQYFISPHLTLNVGYGQGIEGEDLGLSPESRILIGLSSCQGIGSYSRVTRKEIPKEEVVEEVQEPVKTLKIKTLSPLLIRPKPLDDTPSVVPQLPDGDIDPEQVTTPPAPAIPVVSLPELLEAEPAATAVELPVDENVEIQLDPTQNISSTESFDNLMDARSVSPVGPPAMASTVRAPVDAGKPARVYRRFLLPEFSFETDQHSLTPEGSAALSMIAVELSSDSQWYAMRIDGHTDSTGSDRYNNELSIKRAIEYAMHLVANNGVDPSRVFVKGFGESKPITDNETTVGRSKNRRVELLVLVPAE